MRALFIQQDHVSPVGPMGERFAQRGFDVVEMGVVPEDRFHQPDVEVDFPDPTKFDVIVPMGAPWSVYDDDTIGTWIDAEIAMLRKAHDSGVPILGICFGGQGLASALGGSVEKAPVPEHGWMSIDSSAPDLIEAGPWFAYHSDRWITPPGAAVLATTPQATQAFSLGRSLAVQFHPELIVPMLQGWYDNGGADHFIQHGVDPDAVMAATRREEPAAIERAHRLVDRFLDQVATSPPVAAANT